MPFNRAAPLKSYLLGRDIIKPIVALLLRYCPFGLAGLGILGLLACIASPASFLTHILPNDIPVPKGPEVPLVIPHIPENPGMVFEPLLHIDEAAFDHVKFIRYFTIPPATPRPAWKFFVFKALCNFASAVA
jgi:hypothetical protein